MVNLTFREYWTVLRTAPARTDFAKRCKTSPGYLNLVAGGFKRASAGLAINIERESGAIVTAESVHPDADWAYIRGTERKRDRRAAA